MSRRGSITCIVVAGLLLTGCSSTPPAPAVDDVVLEAAAAYGEGGLTARAAAQLERSTPSYAVYAEGETPATFRVVIVSQWQDGSWQANGTTDYQRTLDPPVAGESAAERLCEVIQADPELTLAPDSDCIEIP